MACSRPRGFEAPPHRLETPVTTRRHRHRKTFIDRVKRRWWLIPIALVSVAAVLIAGIQFGAIGWLTNAIAPIVGACTEKRPIVVATDPSIAGALTAIAADFDETRGNCTTTEIRSLLSADVAALFATGVAGDLDAWVPDSSAWLDRAAATATSLRRRRKSLTSPIRLWRGRRS